MAIFDNYDRFFDDYSDYMFDMFGEIIEPEDLSEVDDYDDQLLMADMESYIEWDE